jgi:hypothetical protein
VPFHLLDLLADSNYPVIRREMHTCSNQRGFQGRPMWVALLCVLLAALFLYNPFVVLISPTGNVAYQSLSRNRATVGSCELQQFSPQKTLHPPLAVFFVSVVANVSQPIRHTWRPAHLLESHITPPSEIPCNLWFRPPPAA